jgi:hypothetical protein
MHEVFRFCRIGTTTSLGATGGATHAQPDAAGASNVGIAGWLEPGSFRCKRQWIDYFGNLSPLSEASDEIRFSRQIAVVNPTGVANRLGPVDVVRKQIAWSGLTAGRDGTLGQTLFRTTDLKNSGDAGYYELPQDAAGNAQAFATLPDNITTIYPDNIPDVWLGAAPLAPIAMPQFRLCRQAFSRLFMAQGGALYWSMVGRWGTILEDSIMYPDPSSAKITGLAKMAGGLVVFTERSTYLVTPNDSGEGFRSMVLNPQIGCAAPNSIQTMPDGVTIWLAREGFYVLVDGKVLPISADEDRTVRRFTPGRMQQAVSAIDQRTREYRCWVSMDGDTENTLCLCFRDGGWTRRTDVQASAVCTTQDHRAYMIAGGEVTKWDTDPTAFFRGVWVLDHESQYYQADNAAREAILETAWLNVGTSDIRKTTYKLFLWLIETSDAQLTIEVLRDWRNDVVETCTVERHTTEDVPMFFNEIAYDSTDANRVWRRRRPYYTKAEIFVPSAEVVKFRIRGTGFWEFIGLKWVDSPRMAGGHRIQR